MNEDHKPSTVLRSRNAFEYYDHDHNKVTKLQETIDEKNKEIESLKKKM